MPTNTDIPRLINDVSRGLNKNGSGHIAELAAKFGRFAGEFLKGYAAGQLARAKLAHEQMLDSSKKISAQQKQESREMSLLWSLYGPTRKPNGDIDPGNHEALMSGIRQLASKNNDDILWNLAQQGDHISIERLIAVRDGLWGDNEKFLKVQQAQERIDRQREQDQEKELRAERKEQRDEAAEKRRQAEADRKARAQEEKEQQQRDLMRPWLAHPDQPAAAPEPAAPAEPATPPATSGDPGDSGDTSDTGTWKPSLDRSEAEPSTDVASLGDPSTDMTPTPRVDDPDLADWRRQQQHDQLQPPQPQQPSPDTPTSQFRYPQTAAAGVSDVDPGIQLAQATPQAATAPATATPPSPSAAAPAPQFDPDAIDREAHHLMQTGQFQGGVKNTPPAVAAAVRARASQIQAGLDRIMDSTPQCTVGDKKCQDIVLSQIRKVDPWWADQTRQWINGSTPAPRSFNALKEPYATLIRLGGKVDPTFTSQTAATRGRALIEWSSGANGRNIVSIATAYRHLKDGLALLGSYDQKGVWHDNPNAAGAIAYAGAQTFGTKWMPGALMSDAQRQWFGSWHNTVETAATEYTRALTQGVPRQTQLSRELDELNYNKQDIATLRANIEDKMHKLQARLDTQEMQFRGATGRQPEDMYKVFGDYAKFGKGFYAPVKGDELGATVPQPDAEAEANIEAMRRDRGPSVTIGTPQITPPPGATIHDSGSYFGNQ
jgi:hypothetical protein